MIKKLKLFFTSLAVCIPCSLNCILAAYPTEEQWESMKSNSNFVAALKSSEQYLGKEKIPNADQIRKDIKFVKRAIVGIKFQGLVLSDKKQRLEAISKFKLAYPYINKAFGSTVAEELLNRMQNESDEIQVIYDISNMLCEGKQLPTCSEKLKNLLLLILEVLM